MKSHENETHSSIISALQKRYLKWPVELWEHGGDHCKRTVNKMYSVGRTVEKRALHWRGSIEASRTCLADYLRPLQEHLFTVFTALRRRESSAERLLNSPASSRTGARLGAVPALRPLCFGFAFMQQTGFENDPLADRGHGPALAAYVVNRDPNVFAPKELASAAR